MHHQVLDRITGNIVLAFLPLHYTYGISLLMKNLDEKRILDYKIQDLFDLVMDIESYPQFLPWVSDAVIISSGKNHIIADLTASFASVKQCYRSNVTYELYDNKAYIQAESHTGPFEHLLSRWDLTSQREKTLVEFTLEFELKSKIMTNLVGPVIIQAQKKMISAFEERARIIIHTT